MSESAPRMAMSATVPPILGVNRPDDEPGDDEKDDHQHPSAPQPCASEAVIQVPSQTASEDQGQGHLVVVPVGGVAADERGYEEQKPGKRDQAANDAAGDNFQNLEGDTHALARAGSVESLTPDAQLCRSGAIARL